MLKLELHSYLGFLVGDFKAFLSFFCLKICIFGLIDFWDTF